MRGWTLTAQAPGELELLVYGDIWAQAYDETEVSAASFARQLSEHADARLIRVRINSRGGDAFAGIAIYNLLATHPARVEVTIEGLAASAASAVAMAGDRIILRRGAQIMIHLPAAFGGGNADEMRRSADTLDKLTSSYASIYAARTGLSSERLRELMADEVWMEADEALSLGFVDEIAPEPVQVVARGATVYVASVGYPAGRVPPNLRGAAPTAGGSIMNDKALIAVLKAMFKLDAGATNEEVVAALVELVAAQPPKKTEPEPKTPEPAPAAPPPAAAAPKAPQAKTPAPAEDRSEALAAFCQLLTPEGQETLDTTAALAEALRLRTVQPALVDVALREGRITPAEASALRPLEQTAAGQLKALLSVMPAGRLPTGGPQAAAGAADTQAPSAVPQHIIALAKRHGTDPEVVWANMQRQA